MSVLLKQGLNPLLPGLAAMLLMSGPLPGQVVPHDSAGEQSAQPPAQLAKWIDQLDADEFAVRENATEQLVAAGRIAIVPLAEALGARGPEAAARGVYVLQQLALSGDLDTQEQAREALQQVAAGRDVTAARKANATLAKLDDLRQDRSLNDLLRLGAKASYAHRPVGAVLVPFVRALEIDDDWMGTDEDLGRLKWVKDVEQLTLRGDKVSDPWLKHAAQMENLTAIAIKKAAVSDEAVAFLAKIEKLSELEVKYVPISDRSLTHLRQLKGASSLKLYGTNITRQAAIGLKAELVGVHVDYRAGAFLGVSCHTHPLGAAISLVQPGTAAFRAQLAPGDVVVKYGGKSVSDFEKLTDLISQHRVGEEVTMVVARRAQTRSRLLSADDVKKPLGIEGKQHVLGCQVTQVAPDSIGSRVGLQAGDVVYRFQGKRISRVDDLDQMLQVPAAQPPVLEWTRGFQILSKRIKLGEWE